MSTLPIPHPTHGTVLLAKIVEGHFGGATNNRLDLIVAHYWDRIRLGAAVKVGGRLIPGAPEIVKDKTLYRTSLLGDTLGPFLAYVGQNLKGLDIVLAGTVVGGVDTLQGHVITLRDGIAWIPSEEQLKTLRGEDLEPASY